MGDLVSMWYVYFAYRQEKWLYPVRCNTGFITREDAHERVRQVVHRNRREGIDFVYRIVWE